MSERAKCRSLSREKLNKLKNKYKISAKSKAGICRGLQRIRSLEQRTRTSVCTFLEPAQIRSFAKANFGVDLKGSKSQMCRDYRDLDETYKALRKDVAKNPNIRSMPSTIDRAISMLESKSHPVGEIREYLELNGIPAKGTPCSLIYKLSVLKTIVRNATRPDFVYRDLYKEAPNIMPKPRQQRLTKMFGARMARELSAGRMWEPAL